MLTTIKPPVWFIILIIGFPQLSETIFAPLLPFIVDKFNTTQTLSQMSLSVFFVGFAVGVLFWGSLSDRIGRKKALSLGILSYIIGSFLLYTSSSIYMFLFCRVIQAFGAASGSVISQTILRECFIEEKERVKTFSTIAAALAWTPALGPFFGGQIVTYFKMETVFLFLVILGIGIWVCSAKVLQETHKEQTDFIGFWTVLKKMITDIQIYINVFLVAGLNAIIFSIYSESPFVFMNVFGWSAQSYSFIGIGMALFSVFGSYLNKKFAQNNWTSNERVQTGLIWIVFSSSLYILPDLFQFNVSSYFVMGWMLFSICLIFIGIVISLPSILSEALNSYKGCLGTAGALFGFSYYLVLSILLGLISFFSSESLIFLGLVVIILSIVMLFLTNTLKKQGSKAVSR